MSSSSAHRQRHRANSSDICVTNINPETNQAKLLEFFSRYGQISQFNPTRSKIVFFTYETRAMADRCMNSRPHRLDGRTLYVKRALPDDPDHPRERYESTEELMIVLDCPLPTADDQTFLDEVKEYFSSYGQILSCNYEQEEKFNYIRLKFDDRDSVDQIILDKPHFYQNHQLDLMKFIPINIKLTNEKCGQVRAAATTPRSNSVEDHRSHSSRSRPKSRGMIDEEDLQSEVFHLQATIQQINEDFARQRRALEDDCAEQLKALNESTEKTRRLHEDLQKEYETLLQEYETIQKENAALNEEYLMAELENFELKSYYDQLLVEKQQKTLPSQTKKPV